MFSRKNKQTNPLYETIDIDLRYVEPTPQLYWERGLMLVEPGGGFLGNQGIAVMGKMLGSIDKGKSITRNVCTLALQDTLRGDGCGDGGKQDVSRGSQADRGTGGRTGVPRVTWFC